MKKNLSNRNMLIVGLVLWLGGAAVNSAMGQSSSDTVSATSFAISLCMLLGVVLVLFAAAGYYSARRKKA